MKKMYKVNIAKLIGTTVVVTVVVVVTGGLLFNYFFKENSGEISSVKIVKDKMSGRLTKGLIEEKIKVKPEEAVLQAVTANRSRIIKIYSELTSGDEQTKRKNNFLGRGIILTNEGLVVTGKGGFVVNKKYAVVVPGRSDIFEIEPVLINEYFAFFKLPAELAMFASLDSKKPEEEDLVVAISGREDDSMATGKIVKIVTLNDSIMLYTTIPSSSIEVGAPLINQEKKIIGMYVSKSEGGKSVFISSRDIRNNMKSGDIK